MESLEQKIDGIIKELKAFKPNVAKFEEQLNWLEKTSCEIYKVLNEHKVSPYVTERFRPMPEILEKLKQQKQDDLKEHLLNGQAANMLSTLTYPYFRTGYMGLPEYKEDGSP